MEGDALYQEFSKMMGGGESKILPQIIRAIADEKEIKILMKAFPPATAAELALKSGIPQIEVEMMIQDLFQKGLIFQSKKEGDPKYYRVKSVPQFHDSSVLWLGATREFLDLWKEYTEKEE